MLFDLHHSQTQPPLGSGCQVGSTFGQLQGSPQSAPYQFECMGRTVAPQQYQHQQQYLQQSEILQYENAFRQFSAGAYKIEPAPHKEVRQLVSQFAEGKDKVPSPPQQQYLQQSEILQYENAFRQSSAGAYKIDPAPHKEVRQLVSQFAESEDKIRVDATPRITTGHINPLSVQTFQTSNKGTTATSRVPVRFGGIEGNMRFLEFLEEKMEFIKKSRKEIECSLKGFSMRESKDREIVLAPPKEQTDLTKTAEFGTVVEESINDSEEHEDSLKLKERLKHDDPKSLRENGVDLKNKIKDLGNIVEILMCNIKLINTLDGMARDMNKRSQNNKIR